ncbi:hypothetical protein A3J98_00020 [candidate division WS6 bacterium RIFOXYC1_FULL_33_10]|uniref:Uncharacterized protein n=1 Tax=candidate division WS6 bacterium RIFOXYC1_FULL_33_10 TaxID=1802606 RepID=A0A1F4UP38_9BACT|nr:MAG: hypothetical protein A3J98_00020 [candidate division WS6 bacterium RIFOXYC1_FULL_33_10]
MELEYQTKEKILGAISSSPQEDEHFMNFLYERASRVEEEMPDMNMKVSNASREILRMDHYPGGEDFKAYICPVKVMRGKNRDHPILLTYCTSTRLNMMLYWPMDMVRLTNDERCTIWNNFVKDDEFFYQTGQY